MTKDPVQAAESVKRLLPLDLDTLVFGHFPPLVQDAKGAVERLVGRSYDRAGMKGG